MESQTSLVRSNCAVELYTVTFVDLYLAIVIYPRNLERNDALRLYQTLKQADCSVLLLICIDHQFQ